VKVRIPSRTVAAVGRMLAASAVVLTLIAIMSPAPASAITRQEVLSRASSWVRQGVIYSQSSNHDGYRRDCSGFVSMAWKLSASYTTRTISSRSKRVALSALKPGDAVLQPGHVQIFAGWADHRQGTFIAIEESNWGRPALRRVKPLPDGGIGLRFAGIEEAEIPSPTAAAELLSALPPVQQLPIYVLPSNNGTAPMNDVPDL
jgi:hypothetical protein